MRTIVTKTITVSLDETAWGHANDALLGAVIDETDAAVDRTSDALREALLALLVKHACKGTVQIVVED